MVESESGSPIEDIRFNRRTEGIEVKVDGRWTIYSMELDWEIQDHIKNLREVLFWYLEASKG